MTEYTSAQIEVLAGLEAVRRRPAMYVGSTGPQGLHHLVFELVENSIDESLAGHATRIEVTLHADGSCAVEDDGRGIPVDVHPEHGRPAAELVLTTLHAGGKFGAGAYAFAGGLHGVGVSCVNALSAATVLEVWRDGKHHRQRFARGRVASELEVLGPAERTGTRVRFDPDPEIFSASFDAALLARRLEELAFLHPGVHTVLVDERDEGAWTFHYDTGIVGFVARKNEGRVSLHPEPILVAGEHDGVRVEAALQWTTSYMEDLSTFVNSIHTPQGGSHAAGLHAALTQVVNAYAEERRLLDRAGGEDVTGYDIREGLTAVLSVRMPEPEFEGQTKRLLSSPEVADKVEHVVGEGLRAFLEAHSEVALRVVGKALEASRARLAARRASERAHYQVVDPKVSEEVYQEQFGIRSENWHESCTWLTHEELLELHGSRYRGPEDGVLLDVCCGSGVVGQAFRGRVGRIVGLDLTPQMIEKARTRLDEVHQGNVYEIPFEEGTFDAVCTREVLHLLPRPERPVAQMLRVLKPGGQLVVGQILPYGADDAAWMFRIFKKKQPLFFNNPLPEDFVAMLEGAGFVGVEMVETRVWESIDLWIDTHETTSLHRHEIRRLYYTAPPQVRRIHPFEVSPDGKIRDCWRWCVFSAFKPG